MNGGFDIPFDTRICTCGHYKFLHENGPCSAGHNSYRKPGRGCQCEEYDDDVSETVRHHRDLYERRQKIRKERS